MEIIDKDSVYLYIKVCICFFLSTAKVTGDNRFPDTNVKFNEKTISAACIIPISLLTSWLVDANLILVRHF